MIKDHFLLATSGLKERKLRSWLTMLGVFIGIAAIVSLIGLGEGLRNAITSQFNMLGSDMITVQAGGVQFGPPGSGVVKPLEDGIEDKINKINGVKYAIPRLIKSTKVEYNNKVIFTVTGSMPNGIYRKEVEDIAGMKILKGRLLNDGDQHAVVLGNNYIKESQFGKAVNVGDQITIQEKQFKVVGILKKSGTFFLDGAVIMNNKALKELFGNTKDISIVAVRIKKGENIESIKENIEKLLRKERNVKVGEEDFQVELAIDTIKTLDSTLFAVQLFIYIIASISLLVGGIGITNTMYTAVVERTKNIGIMKAIGAKNSDIFILFFIESGLLGLVGGIIGVVLGASLAKGLAYIGAQQLGSDLIQAQISLALVIGALLFSFAIGCIAGITPAYRASRLHPVDALRYTK